MMFRRRQPQALKDRMRDYFWPRIGLRRAWRYLMHRMLRIDDTSYGIAAGLASGIAISFTPFVGFHFVLAALLAWLIRANIIASALGTLVGNPWTLPFIYVCTYEVGMRILGAEHAAMLPDDITLKYLIAHPMRLLLPMMVGGLPTAILAWFVTFFPLKVLVARAQKLRRHRRAATRAAGTRKRAKTR
jgi:uncharacterized protein